LIELSLEGKQVVVVGHRASGVLAKALAMAFNISVVAFEASAVGTALIGENVANYSRPRGEIVNVDPLGALFVADADDDVSEQAVNLDLPRKQSWLTRENAFETFCMVAAGCVLDDRFDHICGTAVGMEKYAAFFAEWGRDRNETI
jgi:hypothetical protein